MGVEKWKKKNKTGTLNIRSEEKPRNKSAVRDMGMTVELRLLCVLYTNL